MLKIESSQAPLGPHIYEPADPGTSIPYQGVADTDETQASLNLCAGETTATIAAGTCIASCMADPEIAVRPQESVGVSDFVAVEAAPADFEAEPMDDTTDESITTFIEFTKELASTCLGIAALAATTTLMARGGNFKNTRLNLQNQGKSNAKEKMTPEQRKIRRRKRKKKH